MRQRTGTSRRRWAIVGAVAFALTAAVALDAPAENVAEADPQFDADDGRGDIVVHGANYTDTSILVGITVRQYDDPTGFNWRNGSTTISWDVLPFRTSRG